MASSVGSAFPERGEPLDEMVGQDRLAVDAPELARAARRLDAVDVVGRELPVQREDRADLGAAGVALAELLGVGDERSHGRPHRRLVLADADRVVEGLRHLPAVRPGDQRGVGQQRLRLEQHLAVEPVEAPDDLARELEVRDLVLPDRHELGADDRDVDHLQHGVAEQSEVRGLALGHVAQPFLVRGHALEPPERRDHPEQERHLRHLRDVGLAVDHRALGIEPRGEPIEGEAFDEPPELIGAVVVRRQHVPVGDEEEALVGVVGLQGKHVLDVPRPMPHVERARGPVTGQHALRARRESGFGHDGRDDSAGSRRASDARGTTPARSGTPMTPDTGRRRGRTRAG